jgi:hypothetical protein
MGKQIKQSDISEADVFGAIGASAEKNIQKVEALNVELKGIAKAVNDTIKKTGKNSEKEINILVQLSKTLNDLTTKIVKNNKAITDSEILRTKAMNAQEIALEKLRREQQKTAFEAEKQAIAINKARNSAKEAERPYNKLSTRLNELRKNYKDLAVAGNENSASARKMKAEIDSLDKTLKRVDGNVGQFQRNVGNYSSAFGKMGGALGMLGGVFGASLSFDALKGVADGLKEMRIQAQQLGYEGENIERLAVGSKALANTFKDDQANVMRSANTIVKEFGVSIDEAMKQLENGYLTGANAQGDLTDQVKEYSTQIKASGGDANTLMAIISKSNQAGIFSDKGVDAVKEFGLRIREQTTATSDAMNNAFGKEFTDKIFKGINDGSMTSIEALELISKKMNDASIPTNKLQTVIADVFGGAGEDAGLGFLKTLTDINSATNDLVNSNDPLVRQQQETLRLNKELAQAQNDFAESVGGTGTSIDNLILKAKVLFFQYLIPASGWILKLTAGFVAFKTATLVANTNFKELISSLFSFKKGAEDGAGGAQKLGNALKGIGFSVAIGLAIEFARSLYDVASGAQSAREQHELLQKSIKLAEKDGNKFLSTLQKTRDLNVKALQDEAKRTKMSETEYKKRLKLINDEYQFKIKGNIKYNNELKKSNKEEAQEIAKALRINADSTGKYTVAQYKQASELIKSLGGRSEAYSRIDALKIMIAESNEYLKVFYSELKALNPVVDEFAVVTEKTTKATEKKTKATEKEVTALREQLQLIREIEGAYLDMEADDLSGRIEQATRSQLANIQDAGSYTIDVLNDLIAKETELKKAIIERQYYDDIAGGMNIELATAKRNKAIQDLDEEQLFKKKDILDELETAQENYYNQDLDNQKDYVDKTEEFNKKLRDFSRQTADEIINQLKRVSEERESEFDRRIDAEQRLQDQLAEQANAGNIQAQQSILASQQAEQKATIAKQKEQQKQQRLDEINILMKAIQQNIDNGDSIPVALGKAGSQVGIVKAFVDKVFGNVKGFFDGTEGTLADENTPLKSGKDGHLIWADGNEKIMKGDYVKKLASAGLTKTSDIVSSAIMYQNIATKGTQVGYSIDLGSVVNELRDLKQTIKNKPETTISPLIIEGMAKGVVESHKQGNVTRLNKYLS